MAIKNKDEMIEQMLESSKARGRKPGAIIDLTTDAPLDGDMLLAQQNLMAEHRIQVMAQFGEGLPYDRERVIGEARFYMGTAAEAMLEAGKRLILLKEIEGHGEFIAICEERLGVPERAAQKMMSAATKYLSPKLQASASALAPLGKTKLIELMAEDDDALAGLAEGGTVAGLKLDDVERMTCRELRTALRDSRANHQAQGDVMANKSAELDKTRQELEKVRRQVQTLTTDERAKELRVEVAALAFEAEADITGKLREGFIKLAEHAEEHGMDHRPFKAAMVRQLEGLLAAIRSEFHLPEAAGEDEFPWLGQAGTQLLPAQDA